MLFHYRPTGAKVTVDGVYGQGTRAAVVAFQDLCAVPGGRGVVTSVTWNAITNVYDDLYQGYRASEGQYPGYVIR